MSNHFITLEEASALVQANGVSPNPNSITYSAKAFLALMAQEEAEGIRAHFGVNEAGSTTLVFTAVDSCGRDIQTPDGEPDIIIGIGERCPPMCNASSPIFRA